jgi:hypothetical protein
MQTPCLNSPAAAFSLVGTASRDRSYGEAGGAGSRQVAGNSSEPRINDVSDSGNGEGCLGHVGGHNDFVAFYGINPALFGSGSLAKRGSTSVSGYRRPLRRSQVSRMSSSVGIKMRISPDLFEPERIHRLERHVHVGCFALFFQGRVHRKVLHIDRVQSAFHLDHGRTAEGCGEFLRVQGGGS